MIVYLICLFSHQFFLTSFLGTAFSIFFLPGDLKANPGRSYQPGDAFRRHRARHSMDTRDLFDTASSLGR